MKSYIYFLLILMSLFGWNSLYAAQADWIIEPKYTRITPYSDNLVKVGLYNKVGILDFSGKVIVPVTADSITYLQNGYALVLQVNNQDYQLIGILHADMTYHKIDEKYFIGDYAFFSEHKLPVRKLKMMQDFYGYIDPTGQPVTKFSYSMAYPFSEGLAAVSSGTIIKLKHNKMTYINELGLELKLDKSLGTIYGATSFRNGEAMVTRKDKATFFIDRNGQVIREDKVENISFDSLHRLIVDQEVEEENFTPDELLFEQKNLSVFAVQMKVGLLRKKSGGKEVSNSKDASHEASFGNVKILFSSLSARANASNTATINLILRNEGNHDTNVDISVIGASISNNKNIVVPANGRKALPIRFNNVTSFETRKISVSIIGKNLVATRSVNVKLEPDLSDL